MLGVLVNGAAILLGATIGLLLKKGIPAGMGDTIMKGLSLCVIYIGISGALKSTNLLILISSMVLGGVIGEALDLDGRLNRLVMGIEAKFAKKPASGTSIGEGFITASLVYCVGAMAVVGSLQAGLVGNNEMLFTKAMLDGVSSIIFASSLGAGVLLSSVPVVVFQGAIVLLADFVAPYLTEYAIGEMTGVGSLLIMAIGLNLLKLTDIKIMNLMPAVFLPILFCYFL